MIVLHKSKAETTSDTERNNKEAETNVLSVHVLIKF